MAKEILAVPESKLREVRLVILAGLWIMRNTQRVSNETRQALYDWCNGRKEYLEKLESD